MRNILCRLFIAVLMLVASLSAGAASADDACRMPADLSLQKAEQRASCDGLNSDAQSVAKAMYAGGSDSVVVFRVTEQGPSLLSVVTVVILVPGMAILLGSWLAKSSK